MKITHIGRDSQFLSFVSDVFESVAPGANRYIVLSDSEQGTIRYPMAGDKVQVVPSQLRGAWRVPFDVRSSDMIIAHSMTPHAAIAFASARSRTLKVWSGWGFDYYGSDEDLDHGLLGDKTSALSESLGGALGQQLTNQALRGRLASGVVARVAHRTAASTDYFSAPIPDDYAVFRRRFPEFHGEYSQLNYGSVADTFERGGSPLTGSNILVGNSASKANNHLEVFELLTTQDLSGREVVVPLSYGDPAFRDAVIDRGNELFGSAFRPLVDFLPLHEYAAIVASCDVVIMNQRRQQALGNIGSALYYGAQVFLDEVNPTLGFLRTRGARISSMRDLAADGLPCGRLSAAAVAANRSVLESFWGSAQVVKNVETLIGRIAGGEDRAQSRLHG